MALTTPILFSVGAIDASKAYDFDFNVIGGDRVYGSRLNITEDGTSTTITNDVTSFTFVNTLPANTLTNGKSYTATLQTKDGSTPSVWSNTSNTIAFYCYSTPTFAFTVSPMSISASNVTLNVAYTRGVDDVVSQLSEYVFNLYDSTNILISTSGTLRNTQLGNVTVSYSFSGLENNSTYYATCTGITKEGMEISTSKLTITVSGQTETFDYFIAENNCENGYIDIISNISNIEGETNVELIKPYNYVNLTADGDYVRWRKDYIFPNSWTAQIWGEDFNANTVITQFSTAQGDIIKLYYMEENGDFYFVLTVTPFLYADSSSMNYVNQSNTTTIGVNKKSALIKYENGLYSVEGGEEA